jgi:hypothetical protein
MSDSTPARLEVISREGQVYVMVPTESAADLRTYLQARGIFPAPPQVVSQGVSSLTLMRKADVTLVQTLLDRWAA